MEATKYIKLFDSMYVMKFDQKDTDMLNSILDSRPTIEEFEHYCESWNIMYSLEALENNLEAWQWMKLLVIMEI